LRIKRTLKNTAGRLRELAVRPEDAEAAMLLAICRVWDHEERFVRLERASS